MKSSINIKNYPISNKYHSRKLDYFFNLSFTINKKYNFVEIKKPIKPKFLQTRLSWLNESEPYNCLIRVKIIKKHKYKK